MTREELLRSNEYWMTQIQSCLYDVIQKYMDENQLNRTELAGKLGVTKSYVTQVLNGDFDHKISKLVELAVQCNAAPVLHFMNLDTYIKEDAADKYYDFIPFARPKYMVLEMPTERIKYNQNPQKFVKVANVTLLDGANENSEQMKYELA